MFQHPLSGNCKIFLWLEVAKSKYDTRGALEVHPAKWNDCAWRQQTTCATLTFRMWRCVLSGKTGTLIHSKWVFIYLFFSCYQVGVSRDLTIIKILVRSSDHDRFLFKLRRGHRACRMVTNFMKLHPEWGHRIHMTTKRWKHENVFFKCSLSKWSCVCIFDAVVTIVPDIFHGTFILRLSSPSSSLMTLGTTTPTGKQEFPFPAIPGNESLGFLPPNFGYGIFIGPESDHCIGYPCHPLTD